MSKTVDMQWRYIEHFHNPIESGSIPLTSTFYLKPHQCHRVSKITLKKEIEVRETRVRNLQHCDWRIFLTRACDFREQLSCCRFLVLPVPCVLFRHLLLDHSSLVLCSTMRPTRKTFCERTNSKLTTLFGRITGSDAHPRAVQWGVV
jgi:hypothetical protein